MFIFSLPKSPATLPLPPPALGFYRRSSAGVHASGRPRPIGTVVDAGDMTWCQCGSIPAAEGDAGHPRRRVTPSTSPSSPASWLDPARTAPTDAWSTAARLRPARGFSFRLGRPRLSSSSCARLTRSPPAQACTTPRPAFSASIYAPLPSPSRTGSTGIRHSRTVKLCSVGGGFRLLLAFPVPPSAAAIPALRRTVCRVEGECSSAYSSPWRPRAC